MRFCPQCGAPLMAGAKFCVECGRPLDKAAAAAGPSEPSGAEQTARMMPLTAAFVGVFIGITVVGIVAAAWILLKPPDIVRSNAATAPPPSATASGQSANASGGAGQLPAGHPKIELPTEARSFIDKVEKDAESKPNDVAAWNRYGAVAMRAAMFDASYYTKAEDAYAHVLKLQPDNLDALRGIGDIDYDHQKYDQAIAAYEHFLKLKPDDPEVRTDLGTMYLYTGNADQAIVQYRKVTTEKPDFFQAFYNMGIAYAQQNKQSDAAASLNTALKLAPDDNTKSQVRDLLAKLNGAPGASATGGAAAAAASSSSAPGSFHGAIEQMMRGLPIAGPKVGSVQWASDTKARVMFDNFPMDQMPPFAKDKFMSDLKAGIDSAKKSHNVSSPVEVDLVDGSTGNVMQAVTE
jgi:tetratricopeptide (TPR) repeat protein